jgi:hypothetical protein
VEEARTSTVGEEAWAEAAVWVPEVIVFVRTVGREYPMSEELLALR